MKRRPTKAAPAHAATDTSRACGGPPPVPATLAEADALRHAADAARAVRAYRALLARDPYNARAWLGLVRVDAAALSAADVAALCAARSRPDLSEDDRAAFEFALAEIAEVRGDYRGALGLLQAANARVRRRLRWDAREFRREMDALCSAFGSAPEPAARNLGAGLVFIVGLPRSGARLLERILGAHRDVQAGGESPLLASLIDEESRRHGLRFPAWVPDLSAADRERLALRFLERCGAGSGPQLQRAVTLRGHWRHAGMLCTLLPGARVIDCRRDPLETLFACYRRWFGADHGYAFDFEELAAYRRGYERVTDLWQRRHPEQVRRQGYEALQADPAGEIRALLAFCGLPYDPACVRYERTTRERATLLRRDAQRAATYGVLLDPLRAALTSAS